MLKHKATPHTTHQDVKDQLLDYLHGLDPDTEEFSKAMNQYQVLCTIEADKKAHGGRIGPWIPAIGNVLGVTVMGLFEQRFSTIFTTKALNVFGNKLK